MMKHADARAVRHNMAELRQEKPPNRSHMVIPHSGVHHLIIDTLLMPTPPLVDRSEVCMQCTHEEAETMSLGISQTHQQGGNL